MLSMFSNRGIESWNILFESYSLINLYKVNSNFYIIFAIISVLL